MSDVAIRNSESIAVFHNRFTCDYHFIIDELVKEFEGQFECLRENTENYITFSVSIKKNLIMVITYKLKSIDSFRFMSSSLSSLVDSLSEIFSKECRSCKKINESVCYFIGLKNK